MAMLMAIFVETFGPIASHLLQIHSNYRRRKIEGQEEKRKLCDVFDETASVMHEAENGSHRFTNAWRSKINKTLNERGILKQWSSDQMRSRYSLHMKFGSAKPASMAKQLFLRYK